ncbi:hypothetical protein CPT_Pepon010 [Stenotrophomonas phage Pepon]|uniref:Uncharacterized protein n=2 Tax=Ponderosavirus TaxID=3424921 RepID=A0AAE8BHV6_9CAUD|nr:hypothetical protein CPT_Pepon010 [Stenotrophomonas phage Pepon]
MHRPARTHRVVKLCKIIERMRVSDGFITTFILDPEAPKFLTDDSTNMQTVRISDESLFNADTVAMFDRASTEYTFTLSEQEYYSHE